MSEGVSIPTSLRNAFHFAVLSLTLANLDSVRETLFCGVN
jgi:hypothetical protein